MRKWSTVLAALSFAGLAGCGQGSNSIDFTKGPQNSDQGIFRLNVCSTLPFIGISWPLQFSNLEKNVDVLALNISGSFEGSNGWGNISDNFDNQGVSLGLLNQNLGQGSLQPQLLQMAASSLGVLQSIFSSTHLNSLMGMLSNWQSGSSESGSVTWAKQNLYSNGRFVTQWRNELTAMASSLNYVNVQAQTAFSYHQAALYYMKALQVRQVRAFLLLFDIVVQNGSLFDRHISEYNTWLSKIPSASETQRLTKIVDIREADVDSQWQAAYRARKMAIVNGAGTVNGEYRRLEKEYCYNGLETL